MPSQVDCLSLYKADENNLSAHGLNVLFDERLQGISSRTLHLHSQSLSVVPDAETDASVASSTIETSLALLRLDRIGSVRIPDHDWVIAFVFETYPETKIEVICFEKMLWAVVEVNTHESTLYLFDWDLNY